MNLKEFEKSSSGPTPQRRLNYRKQLKSPEVKIRLCEERNSHRLDSDFNI